MAETKEKKEPVKYRFGQNDIDLDHYIYNLGNNVQSYVDSQGWNEGQKQEFMNSYARYMQGLQDQLDNNTSRFSTNDFGAIMDSSGELSDADSDSDSGDYYYDKDGNQIDSTQYGDLKARKQKRYQTFSANKAVATYFNKIGKAVVKNPKKSESKKKEKFDVRKHGFLADWQKRNNASGEKMDLKPYLDKDAYNKDTRKRARTNRLQYLSDEIDTYLNNFKDEDYDYEGGTFENGTSYRDALTRLRDHMRDGEWSNDDMILANKAGIGGSFYNHFFTEDENPGMTDAERKKQEEEAEEKLRQDAWKAEVDRRYDIYNRSQNPRSIDRPYYINVGNDYLGEDGTWDINRWRDSFKEGDPYYGMIASGKGEGLTNYLNTVLKNPYSSEFNRAMQYLINNNGARQLSDGRYYIRQESDNDTQSALVYDPARGALYKTFLGDIGSEWDIIRNKFLQDYSPKGGASKYYKSGGVIEKYQIGGNMALEYENSIKKSLEKRAALNGKSVEEQAADERKIGAVYSGAEATAANPDTGFTDIEYARIGSAIADIGSVVTAFVPGAGTVASAATGLGSTFLNAYADVRDDGVSGWQAFKNFGMNLGMDIAGLIPGGGFASKTAKIMRSVGSIIPKVALALGAISTFNNREGIMESINKALDKPSEMNVQDWQNIAQAFSIVAGASTVAGAAYGKKARKTKQDLANATKNSQVAIDVIQGGTKKTVAFVGDDAKAIIAARENNDIDAVNNILKKYEGTKDATIATSMDLGFKKPSKWYKPINIGDTGNGKMAIYDIVKDDAGSYIKRGNWTGDTRLNSTNMPEIYGRPGQTVAAADAAVARARQDIVDSFIPSSDKRRALSDNLNNNINSTQSKISDLNTNIRGRNSVDLQRQIDDITTKRAELGWAARERQYLDNIRDREAALKKLDENALDPVAHPLSDVDKANLNTQIADLTVKIDTERAVMDANSATRLADLQTQHGEVLGFEKDLSRNNRYLALLRQRQQNLRDIRSRHYDDFIASHTNADGKIFWDNPYGRPATEMTKDDFDQILRDAGIMFKRGGSLNIAKVRRFYNGGSGPKKNTTSTANWFTDMYSSPEMQQWLNSFTSGEYEKFNELQRSWAANKQGTGYSPGATQVSYNQGVFDRQGAWNTTGTNTAIQRAVDAKKIITAGNSGDNASGNYQDGYFGEQEFLRHGGTKESWEGREQELAQFQEALKAKGLTYTLDKDTGMYLMGKLETPNATTPATTPASTTGTITNPGSQNDQGDQNDQDNIKTSKLPKEQSQQMINPTITFGLSRAFLADKTNRKLTNMAKATEKPLLQDPFEIHRTVQGDLNAEMQGQQAAATLNSAANRTLTSDGNAQMAAQLEAQNKGLEYINAGKIKSNEAFKTSSELAWEQEKENAKNRHNVAMTNRDSMMRAEANKNKYEQAYESKKHEIYDTFGKQLEYDVRAKQEENKALANSFAESDIHDAITYDLGSYAKEAGIELSPEQLDIWNKVQSGVITPSDITDATEKETFMSAFKIAQYLKNQARKEHYGISNTKWSGIRTLAQKKEQSATNEPAITERPEKPKGKNGIKLEIAGIKAKTANAERFQESIKDAIEKHEKVLDRLSKSLYEQVKILIVK